MKIGSMNNPEEDIFAEIERISKQGFDFIDLTYELPAEAKIDQKLLKKRIDEAKLSVIGHTNPTLPAVYPSKKVREAALLDIKEAFDLFKYLGCQKISIHPFYYTAHMEDDELFKENVALLKKLLEYAESRGLILMIENCFSPFGTADEMEKILKQIPGLMLHLDVGHINLLDDFDSEFEAFLAKFKDKISHCHIHDNVGIKDNHSPLGCGTIDWKKVAGAIKKTGYDKTFTLEVFCTDDEYVLLSKNKWERFWGEA